MSGETLKVVKVASIVLTDEKFSLASFIDKIEPLIKESPDLYPVANTSFILVSRGAYIDLQSCLI